MQTIQLQAFDRYHSLVSASRLRQLYDNSKPGTSAPYNTQLVGNRRRCSHACSIDPSCVNVGMTAGVDGGWSCELFGELASNEVYNNENGYYMFVPEVQLQSIVTNN